MTTTFSKYVNELVCFKNISGAQDVIHTIVWTLVAQDSEGGYGTFNMRTEVPNLPSSGFVPFSSLDEATVSEWIDLYTPVQRMEAAKQYLLSDIEQKKTQTMLPPPWAKTIEDNSAGS